MHLTTRQIEFECAFGIQFAAPWGFGPDDPKLPGLLKEAADLFEIYVRDGEEAFKASTHALKEADEQRASDIMELAAGVVSISMTFGMSPAEGIEAARAFAANLEEQYSPKAVPDPLVGSSAIN